MYFRGLINHFYFVSLHAAFPTSRDWFNPCTAFIPISNRAAHITLSRHSKTKQHKRRNKMETDKREARTVEKVFACLICADSPLFFSLCWCAQDVLPTQDVLLWQILLILPLSFIFFKLYQYDVKFSLLCQTMAGRDVLQRGTFYFTQVAILNFCMSFSVKNYTKMMIKLP